MGSFIESFNQGLNLGHTLENDKRMRAAAQQQAQLFQMQMMKLARDLAVQPKMSDYQLYEKLGPEEYSKFKGAGKTTTPSNLAKTIAERNALQPGDPSKKIYDAKLDPKGPSSDFAMFIAGEKEKNPEISNAKLSEGWKARQIEITRQAAISKGEGLARSRTVKSYDRVKKRFVTHSLWDEQQGNAEVPGRFLSESSAKFAEQDVKAMVIALKEDMPTNDLKVMRQSVPSVLKLIGQARSALEKTKVGPLAGRWKYAMTSKVGLADPNFKRLRVDLSLAVTRLMKMHVGAQGSDYIMKHFKEIIDAGKDSYENVVVALDEIEDYAKEVGMTLHEQREAAGLDEPEAPTGGGSTTKPKTWEELKKSMGQ